MPQVLKTGLLKVTIFLEPSEIHPHFSRIRASFSFWCRAAAFEASSFDFRPSILALGVVENISIWQKKLLLYSDIGSVSLGASFCKETKNIFTLPCPPFPLSPVRRSLSPVRSSLSPVPSSLSPVLRSPRRRPTPRKLPWWQFHSQDPNAVR